jgi:crossover junction endodeoxyribonuclease RuvC
MKTLAIDPGYDRVGIAIIEKQPGSQKEERLHSECFMTDKTQELYERIFSIANHLEKIIKQYKPDRFAIENLFHTKNTKTVMGVAEARGVIIYIARKYKLTISEYTPNQIKNATTGYGKATKQQVYEMVKRLITLPKNIKQDDEIDAIAVGITDLAHARI